MTSRFSLHPSVPTCEFIASIAPYHKFLQPSSWAALSWDALRELLIPILSKHFDYQFLFGLLLTLAFWSSSPLVLSFSVFILLTCPGSESCSLWSLLNASVSGYVPSHIYDKPYDQPYVGTIMSFFLIYFYHQTSNILISKRILEIIVKTINIFMVLRVWSILKLWITNPLKLHSVIEFLS